MTHSSASIWAKTLSGTSFARIALSLLDTSSQNIFVTTIWEGGTGAAESDRVREDGRATHCSTTTDL